MIALTFLVAFTALVISIMAYKKAGGSSADLKSQVDSIRLKMNETLSKVEKPFRGEDKKEG
jgi:hypothetical protein